MGTQKLKLPVNVFLVGVRIWSREHSNECDVTFVSSTKFVAYFLALQNI